MYPNLSSDELAYAIRRYDGGRFSLAFPLITLLIIAIIATSHKREEVE
jgi:hypothetical protein